EAVAGIADEDAIVVIAQGGGPLGIGTHKVALDRAGVALMKLDATEVEAVDAQALDGAAADEDQKTIDKGAGARAVELDQDFGVVAVGQRVHGGARLAVAVDRHGHDESRQGTVAGAADIDGLYRAVGRDIEVNGVVDAIRPGSVGRDVSVEVG